MGPTLPEISGYDVEAELGRGGMGVVYRVRQRTSGTVLALKVILVRGRDVSFEELARFRVEVEAMSCLDHPNIIKIRDVGVVSGYPFFTSEFAELGSLKQRTRGQPQPIPWSVELVRSLAIAVHYSHGRGMLHRDLKPANILFAGCGTPKVSDFGLVKFAAPISKVRRNCCVAPLPTSFEEDLADELAARFAAEMQHQYAPRTGPGNASEAEVLRSVWQQCAARTGLLGDATRTAVVRKFLAAAKGSRLPSDRPDLPGLDDLTRSGSVLGSPQYMAPEQASGDLHRIGRHTDVYALGVILYELLTGRPPFLSVGIAGLLEEVRSSSPVPPGQLRPGIPTPVEAICLKCLEKSPEARYPNASALAKDLSEALHGYSPASEGVDSQTGPGVAPGVGDGSPDEQGTTRSWWPFRRKRSRLGGWHIRPGAAAAPIHSESIPETTPPESPPRNPG